MCPQGRLETLLGLPAIAVRMGHRDVALRQQRVELQGPARFAEGRLDPFLAGEPVPPVAFVVGVGQAGMGRGKVGILRQGPFEKLDRPLVVLLPVAQVVLPALHVEIVGGHARGRSPGEARSLGGRELELKGGDDLLGDVRLHREDVFQLPLVGFGPEMAVGLGLDQLAGDAHPPVGPAHAAFQDVGDVELFGDLAQVLLRPPVAHHRGAGDDR